MKRPITIELPFVSSQSHPTMASPGNLYETPDLYVAAFLLCNEVKLAKTRRRGAHRNQMVWLFEFPEIDDLVNSYFDGSGTVSPRRFADVVRDLKNMTRTF